jgi:transposase
VLRTGSPWRDLPERYGPHTTCYNRFNRWAKAGVWLRVTWVIMPEEITEIDRLAPLGG